MTKLAKGMVKNKDSGIWYYDFKFNKHHHHRSCRTKVYPDALKIMLQKKYDLMEAEEKEVWTTDNDKDITYNEALDYAWKERYASQKQSARVLITINVMRELLGNLKVSKIDKITYNFVAKELRKRKVNGVVCTNNTINKYLTLITKPLEMARDELDAPCTPLYKYKLKILKTKVEVISPEIEEKIFKYMGDPVNFSRCYAGWTTQDLLEILTVGIKSGMRRGEIFGFRAEQFDGQIISFTANQHKTGGTVGDKKVVVPPEIASLITTRIQRMGIREGERVFMYSTDAYTRLWRRMKKKIGYKGKLYPHMMRHTFATKWLEAGMPIKDVSEFLGHQSVTTTEMYTHITPQHLIKSFDKYSVTDSHRKK